MAKLPKDKQAFNEALALAKSEDYRKAEKALRKYKDESDNHAKLYQMLQSKLDAEKPKRNKRRRNIILGTIAAPFIICALLFPISWVWQQFFVTDGTLEIIWWSMCVRTTIDVLVDEGVEFTDAISAAYRDECRRQSESTIAIRGDEVRYCYWQTQKADLDRQFELCLVENEAYLDGMMIGLAVQAAR